MNVKFRKHDESFSTIVEMLQQRSNADPDKLIYRFLSFIENNQTIESEITYSELETRARTIAAWFQQHNASGERALLLYPPGLDYISAFYGCLYAGVIAIPAYPPLSPKLFPRIESIIANAGAKYIMTISPIMNLIRSKTTSESILQNMEWFTTDNIDTDLEGFYRELSIPEDSIAFLQYTSGSTSAPKGVIVSHENLLHNEYILHKNFLYGDYNHCVIWLPPYHDMGLIGGILQPIYADFSCTLMSPLDFLQKPLRWLEAITRYRGTLSAAPNFAYELCNNKITHQEVAALDLSYWDIACNGAETIRIDVIDEFCKKFSPAGFRREAFYPCYGLAESTLIVSGGKKEEIPIVKSFNKKAIEQNKVLETDPSDRESQNFVGCGKALSDGEIRIVNPETLEECSGNTIGEIWLSGPSVARGYWNWEDSENSKVFGAFTKNMNGPYFRTGDLGFLKEGELFVTGRYKDIIIIRGRNYYPQDIEYTAERSHPALRIGCCAVFSIESEGEEKIIILQEIKSDKKDNINVNEVVTAINSSVSEHHEITAHDTVLIKSGTIPKTSSGKLQRWACRKAYLDNRLTAIMDIKENVGKKPETEKNSVPLPDSHDKPSQTIESIRNWLVNKIAEKRKITPDKINIHNTFNSLGLVSLDIVTITGELESWLNRRVLPTLVYNYPTIDLLSKHIAGNENESSSFTDSAKNQQPVSEPLAIVGMACRFPGGADNPEKFWEIIRSGTDAITDIPVYRKSIQKFKKLPDVISQGGYLNSVDTFDPQFFNITPREAASIDPQQRLLLEVTWEAFEDAGLTAPELSENMTGVFIGISNSDYSRIKPEGNSGIFDGTGNALSIASNRISYIFDLKGPSMSVDTACSSSLVAVHLGIDSLRKGESDIVIAGGVNLILSQELTEIFSNAKMLSPDCRCKAFDTDANGYVRGEGCGIIILKRLSDALKNKDTIHAMIRGSAINQDGRSNGLTAPNGPSQEEVIISAQKNAGVDSHDIDYIEAHGTGTPLGDPIELNSLVKILINGRSEDNKCYIGSVKTNIGHLEAAAGIAGLIKTVLSLKHREIPPSLHLKKLNPHIKLENGLFEINTRLRPWEATENRPRIAGVSSFGMGGTNSHIIIEEAPSPADSNHVTTESRRHHILCLSAKREDDLKKIAAAYNDLLENCSDSVLSDFCLTANAKRNHFHYRTAIIGNSITAVRKELASIFTSKEPSTAYKTTGEKATRKIAFMFTGQGSQYPGMGQELYNTQPVFRDTMNQFDEILRDIYNFSLLDYFYTRKYTDRYNETKYVQPSLFALEYSLAKLWTSSGIFPQALIGHSIGEYTAACISGIFSLEDGIRLTAARGELMNNLLKDGSMVSIMESESVVNRLISEYDGVNIAAVNSDRNVVISGLSHSIEKFLSILRVREIPFKQLDVSHAFHSSLMKPVLEDFKKILSSISFSKPSIPLISNVTGKFMTQDQCSIQYWLDHIMMPVRFSDGIKSLTGTGFNTCIEIGPGSVLSRFCRQNNSVNSFITLPTLPGLLDSNNTPNDWYVFLSSLKELYINGIDIDWKSFEKHFDGKCMKLPGYPFDRRSYWHQISDLPLNSSATRSHFTEGQNIKTPEINKPDQSGTQTLPSELIALMREQTTIIQAHTKLIEGLFSPSDNNPDKTDFSHYRLSPDVSIQTETEKVSRNYIKETIEDQLIEIISKISAYPKNQIRMEMKFLDGLGFDSLMITDLISQVKKKFPVFQDFSADIIKYIFSKNASISDLLGFMEEKSNYNTKNTEETTTVIGNSEPEKIDSKKELQKTDEFLEKEIREEYYNIDLFPGNITLKRFRENYNDYNPYFRINEGVAGNNVRLNGKEYINFATFNYLGLNGSPEIAAAVNQAVSQYGTSVSGSRLLTGEIPLHGELEREIAELIGTEDAVVFTGGHNTNVTTIGYLFGPGDLILHDSLAHNSIIQGCLLSGASRRPFPHNNWEALDNVLFKLRNHYQRVLIVLEGVYSMDGDIAELPEIIEVKKRHKAFLMIDEAHSLGVLGKSGGGISEHFNINADDVDIWMGTLSKSFPSCGGYIAGRKALVENLKYSAPGFIFSTGISPANTAASLASIRLMKSKPELIKQLERNGRLFLKLAKENGLNTGFSKDTPIVPVITGSSAVSIALSKALFERDINVMPITYPAVDENKARLRFFISALHTEEQIKETVRATSDELDKLVRVQA